MRGLGGGAGGAVIFFSPAVSDHVAKTHAHKLNADRERETGRE